MMGTNTRISDDLDSLRKNTVIELDEMFKRLNIRKKATLAKADVIIALRAEKANEDWVRRYGKK